MNRGELNPVRLNVWGDSMLNRLPSLSRKRRKREASKKRRVRIRQEMLRRTQHEHSN